MIWWKSCTSDFLHCSPNNGRSGGQQPHRLLRRWKASTRCRSANFMNLHQALDGLATMTDLNMACSGVSLMSCARRTVNAWESVCYYWWYREGDQTPIGCRWRWLWGFWRTRHARFLVATTVPQTDASSLGRWRWSPSIVYGWAPGCLSWPTSLYCSPLRTARRRYWLVVGLPGMCRLIPDPCIMLAVMDFSVDACSWQNYAARVTPEEIKQPVVGFVWNVQLVRILQEVGVTHRVKRLAQIEWYDCYVVEYSDSCSCWDPVGLKANRPENDIDGGGDRRAE